MLQPKKQRNRLRNKRLLVGNSFPAFNDTLNKKTDFVPVLTLTGKHKIVNGIKQYIRARIAGSFDGRTAQKDQLFDITKKVKLSSKAKKMIRKDDKITSLYNKIDKNYNVSMQKEQRSLAEKKKSNNKRYNRR